MTKKITQLTPEQEEQMPVYRDKWLDIGLSTDQSVNDEINQRCFGLVSELVLEEGDPPLEGWVLCDSPKQMMTLVEDPKKVNSDSFFGSFEAGWLSFYDFFKEVVGIQLDPKLDHLIELAQHYSRVYVDEPTLTVYFSRKPTEIHMVNGLLHNEEGPSVLFKDGFCVYSIQGHRLTEQIVMHPETMTISDIHSESNSDIQAIMIERFGWVRYLKETGAELIDSRKNDIENTMEALYHTEDFGDRLVCTCPTGRVFVKGLPPETAKTCQEAQDWLSGYQLEGRKKFTTIGRT